ncbi:unnamed protein product [Rodentolepis nana]|uniref:Uncharacterized protein n=1 Tax=Rodentolepis nana TaxID=102285 RepID=A0A3P7SET9_RODNA|nr:unnamed protein product [Rodentolepis nana]
MELLKPIFHFLAQKSFATQMTNSKIAKKTVENGTKNHKENSSESVNKSAGRNDRHLVPERHRAIVNMRYATDIQPLCSFLGSIRYPSSRENSSYEVRGPINRFLLKDAVGHWSDNCHRVFEKLKLMLK